MGDFVTVLLTRMVSGGPVTGWVLSVYLLVRIHQLTDRQHKANLATVKALTTIKTFLFGAGALAEGSDDND